MIGKYLIGCQHTRSFQMGVFLDVDIDDFDPNPDFGTGLKIVSVQSLSNLEEGPGLKILRKIN